MAATTAQTWKRVDPCRAQVTIGTDPAEIFKQADWALMVGAKPRGPGMERADLLQQNGEIFQIQVCAGLLGLLTQLSARTLSMGVSQLMYWREQDKAFACGYDAHRAAL